MTKILFLGDVVGKPGRVALGHKLGSICSREKPDLVIANGENAAGGLGLDPGTAKEIFDAGVDVITTGNHIWKKREINSSLAANGSRILRPLNYPPGAPGSGVGIFEATNGQRVGVVNAIGRVFMPDYVDCPFRGVDSVLQDELKDVNIIFVDFHCEATSEKVAMGLYLDGRVSVVVGTHTHVQTADERVLPKGTAYITDVGMCGPRESVIGMSPEHIIERFLTSRPTRFEVPAGTSIINGVVVEVEETTGKANSIKRIFEICPNE